MRIPPKSMRFAWALMLSATAAIAGSPDPDEEFFRHRVAPILESRCLRCHGGSATKGGLSLATAEAMKAGGEGGPSFVAGKPEESLLIEKVAGDSPEMPRGGKPLTAEEVAVLRLWIEKGARWPEGVSLKAPIDQAPWWSLRPLERPPVPDVSSPWIRTPVDAFLLAAMRQKGLSPRPEADRRTLIRRVTFDLHGLPPSPEEVDQFLGDVSPRAYENLVDRLLASPRYGERWGRHWLDVARYGDTHGYDKDKRRDHAWPYRDYVIKSLNADKPYGRFVREQVAGDVLHPDDPDAIAATGFVAAGPWDFVGHVELREGTVDKEKTRLIDRDDMIAATMSTFVSMTVHCARCHDHKFDSIPQRDYYRLQAVFAGVERGDRPSPDRLAADRRLALERRREAILRHSGDLRGREEAAAGPGLGRFDRRIADLKQRLADTPRPAANAGSPSNGYHSSIHAQPEATAWVRVDLGRSVPIEEIRLVPARPTDFADSPGFGFPSRYVVEVAEDPEFKTSRTIAGRSGPDRDRREDEPEVFRHLNISGRYVRMTASRLWKRSEDYVFALAELEVISRGRNLARGADVEALDSIEAGRWGTRYLVDGFDSRSARPADSDAGAKIRHDLLASIREAEDGRTRLIESAAPAELRDDRAATSARLAEVEAEILATPPTRPVYALVPHAPREIRVLKRGEVEQPGEAATPGALSCVAGLESDFATAAGAGEGARRVALARWLSDPNNVLTWRSAANRIWHHHFGKGLVDSPSDFGRNGSKPSHPELLDWLAVEFRDGGQSCKALHRLIVTGAAYRQESSHDEAASRLDGDNRLLWRMNRRRLEAEAIRDAILSASGRLDLRMGGPGYEPFRFKDDHSPTYDHEDVEKINDPSAMRRAVYRFAARSVPDPFIDCLDGADPNASTPARNATITALQALSLRNDPFLIAQARAFARRLEAISPDVGRQVEAAYRIALGRPPADGERAILVELASRRGLVEVCRLIYNLNEFLFVD